VDRPPGWRAQVNRLQAEKALKAVRQAVVRGSPLGTEGWQARMASRLKLALTLRSRGRPHKQPDKSS